ncbi:MAG: Na+/H+ antiporter subunit E [Pseudomonadota bacterium]
MIFLLALNSIAAIAIAALSGFWGFGGLVAGFALAYFALWAPFALFGAETRYFRTVWRTIRLAAFFLYDLFVSSVQVAWDVLTPTHLSRPAIVAMPLDVKSDEEITLVANLISLTPGTLSLDVSDDRKTLYVHAMFADDPEGVVRDLKAGMERMVSEVFEP